MKKIISYKILLLFVVLFAACNSENKTIENKEKSDLNPSYAKLFEIKKDKKDFLVSIYDKERKNHKDFRLSDSAKTGCIQIPVKKIICLSTTHLGFLNRLDMRDKICGVGGTNYIYDPKLREYVKQGKIVDVGYEGSLNWEKIIEMQPDLIMGFKVEGEISQTEEMANRYKIPFIAVSEYLEPSPLGQAEWIKLFGLLTGSYDKSLKLFYETSENYLNLKKTVPQNVKKPEVLLNMPFKGTWYVPGGKSNIAVLVKDAGGKYFNEDNTDTHSSPMDIEALFLKADSIDLWLNTGQANSLEDILLTDSRLENFKAFKNGNVYNRNAKLSPGGGNDFMESGIANPDVILKDLIKIIQPDTKNSNFYYYKKLE